MFERVDSISIVELDTSVYDLTVEGEIYCADGIAVHNCPHVLEVRPRKDTIPKCEDLWRGGPMQENDKQILEGIGELVRALEGGPGSGNYGHRGRKGKVGGSLPGGISASEIQWASNGRDLHVALVRVGDRLFMARHNSFRDGLTVVEPSRGDDDLIYEGDGVTTRARSDVVAKVINGELSGGPQKSLPLVDVALKSYKLKATEDDVRQAYTFEMGPMHTTVTSIHMGPNGVRIEGRVMEGDSRVGKFTRTIGETEVHHDIFELDSATQNKGFGSAFYQHSEAAYLKMGVNRVTLSANIDVGGYAWARMGFDFASTWDRQNYIRVIRNKWKSLYSSAPPIKSTSKAWELAALTGPDGRRIGKEMLLGAWWSGEKSLTGTSVGRKVGEVYYASKAKKD